jgi:hypothetical protein
MATYLSSQEITLNEIYPSYSAADASGNTFNPGDRIFFHIKNDNPASVSASVTVTVDDPNTVAPTGGTSFDPDLSIVLGAQMTAMVGPLYASRFADSTTGYVSASYDDVTNVNVAVLRLSEPEL